MAIISSALELVDGDTKPSAPAAGSKSLYIKNGVAMQQDSTGTESTLVNGVQSVAGNTGVVTTGQLVTALDPFFLTPTEGNAAYDPLGAAASAAAASQPVDADLTAIAALTTTPFGRGQLTYANSAAATAALDVATTAAKGLQSAADKIKLDNVWIDVTSNPFANLVGNDSTDNLTAWNALYAAAPVNSIFYFPQGTYRFSAELTMNRNLQCMIKGAGRQRTVIKTTSATANIFNLSIAAYSNCFEDLSFQTTVTKTAGAAILMNNDNALCDVRRCDFNGMFDGVAYRNTTAGNVSTMSECQFGQPSPGGSQIVINGSNINMMFTNVTINVTGVDATGMLINSSGAVQVTGCDFIGGRNTLLINATGVVSALYFNNVFFDQATLGSTVKISGTQPVSRVKFNQCGITNGAANLAACEIAGTGTGTGIPEGIDFVDCDFYNAGFTGTTTGVLVTGCRGFTIKNSRISGFTVGIDITPYSANGVTNFDIQSNTIGPTENFAGNGTGVRINAGAVQYGSYTISNNDMSGNTTAPLVDNGTIAVASSQKQITDNLGLLLPPQPVAPALTLPLTTVTKLGSSYTQFANGARIGSTAVIKATIHKNAATASTVTLTLRNGVNNTNADAAIVTLALAAGTAATGAATIQATFTIVSATTAMASITVANNGATGVTAAPFSSATTVGPIAITALTTLSYWGLYASVATAANIVVDTVSYELDQQ